MRIAAVLNGYPFVLKLFLAPGLGVFALFAGVNTAALAQQTAASQETALAPRPAIAVNRAVGARGKLRDVYWTDGTEKDLRDMRLSSTTRRLARAPAARKHTKVWIARADVCGSADEEILMQIRSPLTCGSLGCEMVVLSEASGEPKVLLRTIGATIDVDATDEIVVDRDSNRRRNWKYRSGRFQQMRSK